MNSNGESVMNLSKTKNGSATASKVKVLLIDDDRVFGRIIKTAATEFEMEVHTLADAPSQRKLYTYKTYDLVLLDYDLESTTGFAFAEVLYRILPDMPVILISSTDRSHDEKLTALPNVVGFLSK